MSAPTTGASGVVLLTPEQLRALVAEAVREALDSREAEPELLDREEAARFLRCSLGTLDRATREQSLPFLLVGDARRFVKADLIVWGRERAR